MNKTTKILIAVATIAALSISALLFFLNPNVRENRYTVVATNFPAYDFARAVTKGVPNASVKLLIKPGVEIHDYEPTPQDIADIKNCRLFVYNDTEAEPWVERIMDQTDRDHSNSFSMYEYAKPRSYSAPDVLGAKMKFSRGSEDEHVWTNLEFAENIVKKLAEKLGSIDTSYSQRYANNGEQYVSQIESVRTEIANIVSTSKRKKIIVGDRFPLRNFAEEFKLEYEAAYDSCEEHSEASAQDVAKLIDTVKNESIPVVFRIELSDGKIASEISRATGAKVLEFHSVHNVSQRDLGDGKTYVDFMRTNAKVLKEALN